MENKPGIGGTIATFIIIILIIIGALYFWGKHVEESKVAQSMQTESANSVANVVQVIATTTVTQ